MRLLICTQAVDRNDPYLSFFHGWLEAFAKQFEDIHVSCLKEGEHALPENVYVHSLGKESGVGRIVYVLRLFRYAWKLRGQYDAVFVHMNQEYVLLCGVLWRLMGKRVYLWRNHYSGTPLTPLAVMLANRVFCTSKYSYTARFKKTKRMPVGIDTELFAPQASVVRIPRSVLFYGRLAPSKNPHVLIDALEILARKGIRYVATIRGTALPHDAAYAESLKEMVRSKGLENIAFEPGLPHQEGPRIFSAAEIYANVSASGMYDKTIFEAAACGALVVASSKDYAELVDSAFVFEEGSVEDLSRKLETLFAAPDEQKKDLAENLRKLVIENHSLPMLADKLVREMSV